MTELPGYDAWKLRNPYDDSDAIGMVEGETCNRLPEPDEDAPRGYRPRRCQGEMVDQDGTAVCDTCGEASHDR